MSELSAADEDAIVLSMPAEVFAARNVRPLFVAVERIVSKHVAAAERALVEREFAERFLEEWARPYFGPDANDAVAAVQRALRATLPVRPDAARGEGL